MRSLDRLCLAVALALALPASSALGAEAAVGAAQANARRLNHSTVIDRPGVYEIGKSFEVGAGGTAIVVRADDVTLDLGGNTLSGPGGPGSVGIAIEGVHNVNVHNGTLDGFGVAVMATDASNLRIRELQIRGRDLGGAPPDVEIGILLIDSRGVEAADNLITDTFLGIFVRGEGSRGNRISGNTLTGGDNGELAICYNPAPGASMGGPSGDLIYGNLISHFNRGIAFSADSGDTIVRENDLATFGPAIVEATPGSNLIVDNLATPLL